MMWNMMINRKRIAVLTGILTAGIITACSSNASPGNSNEAVTVTNTAASEETVNTTVSQTTEAVQDQVTEGPSLAAEIGEDRAKEIAFKQAGVKALDVSFLEVDLDRDDNRLEYDIEFHSGKMEYEVSVDAYTGEIREYSSKKAD